MIFFQNKNLSASRLDCFFLMHLEFIFLQIEFLLISDKIYYF